MLYYNIPKNDNCLKCGFCTKFWKIKGFCWHYSADDLGFVWCSNPCLTYGVNHNVLNGRVFLTTFYK